MRRRILVAILAVTSIAIVLFGVPLALVVERFVDDEATLRLERQAVLAARDVPDGFASGRDPVELRDGVDGTDLALYDRDGRLVAGTGPAVADATTTRALGNDINDNETGRSRVVAVPVSADEQVVGAIRAEQSTAASDARSRRIVALLAALAVGVLGVGAAIAYVVAGRLARPVRGLSDSAIRLGDGDFTVDVPRSGVRELDEAALAMTATGHRLHALVERERTFSVDASHQLRTPLAGLRATIETELDFPRADRTEVLHESLGDIDRLERTITELLTLARTPTEKESSVSLAAVLDDVRDTWHGRLATVGRPLIIADATDVPLVQGTATLLRHALDVVVDNALVHGAGAVRIDHETGVDTVTVSVRDNGPGLAGTGHATASIGDGEPHGLGLPLARRLIEAMPGRLYIADAGPRPRIELILRRADS